MRVGVVRSVSLNSQKFSSRASAAHVAVGDDFIYHSRATFASMNIRDSNGCVSTAQSARNSEWEREREKEAERTDKKKNKCEKAKPCTCAANMDVNTYNFDTVQKSNYMPGAIIIVCLSVHHHSSRRSQFSVRVSSIVCGGSCAAAAAACATPRHRTRAAMHHRMNTKVAIRIIHYVYVVGVIINHHLLIWYFFYSLLVCWFVLFLRTVFFLFLFCCGQFSVEQNVFVYFCLAWLSPMIYKITSLFGEWIVTGVTLIIHRSSTFHNLALPLVSTQHQRALHWMRFALADFWRLEEKFESSNTCIEFARHREGIRLCIFVFIR